MPLIVEPNMTDSDEFYARLSDLHRNLSLDESHKVNARLILLLANHVGDLDVLIDAMEKAANPLEEPSV